MNFPAVCDAMLDKTEFDAVDDEDPARNPSRFPLDQHCERAGRDPAEITRTVVEFDARDLGALASSARALAAAGADGMIVACPADPARTAAIGHVLAESFPG